MIKSAEKRIILIDNYVDYTVFTMLEKREPGVAAAIYTQKTDAQLKLDIDKHDANILQFQFIFSRCPTIGS